MLGDDKTIRRIVYPPRPLHSYLQHMSEYFTP